MVSPAEGEEITVRSPASRGALVANEELGAGVAYGFHYAPEETGRLGDARHWIIHIHFMFNTADTCISILDQRH